MTRDKGLLPIQIGTEYSSSTTQAVAQASHTVS